MTVHARRYGRWCREHFDAPAQPGADPGTPETPAAAQPSDKGPAHPVASEAKPQEKSGR
ncbi:hypothetical protein [Amycolatopsis sp. FDAARGOS 1241]|uniref:hypothetical protein n=1 Tax=Amycolatopsis sp. FDAARGOS 1241 TaxID=2778070 RepID=UPI00194FE17A|nr:hypothetical protein [Amycolatopsis sp. FDAARGOS 1241]QRP48254.1 hypothetical protein I6J71_10470 [Amycolatopsis sp. FDAARGOS 1241]